MPETFSEPYGMVHSTVVQESFANLEASAIIPVTRKLFELQSNPRPEGAESDEQFGPGMTRVMINDINPPYFLIYRIDEEAKRVVVMAIVQKWW